MAGVGACRERWKSASGYQLIVQIVRTFTNGSNMAGEMKGSKVSQPPMLPDFSRLASRACFVCPVYPLDAVDSERVTDVSSYLSTTYRYTSAYLSVE
jgi:hypothetical protein